MRKKEIIYTQDGEIISSKTVQYTGRFHDDKGYGLYSYGNMTSTRTDFELHPNLTDGDLGKLMRLSRHIQQDTNALMFKGHKTTKPMMYNHIAGVLDISKEQGYRFTKKMKEIGVIKDIDVPVMGGAERRLIMNPLYFMAGKHVSDELYWMFQAELDTVFSKWIQSEYETRKNASK